MTTDDRERPGCTISTAGTQCGQTAVIAAVQDAPGRYHDGEPIAICAGCQATFGVHSDSECESWHETLPSGEVVQHCDVFHVREVEIGGCRLDEWRIGPFRSAWSGECACPFRVLADSAGEARYDLIDLHVEAASS